jgi:osmotically-inducible protein OsmY
MHTRSFFTTELLAARPDSITTHSQLDNNVGRYSDGAGSVPFYTSPEQSPPSANHIHIVVNNGLVHVHGDNGSADQQLAVVQAVYDLIGITDSVPMPTIDSLSPAEICETIKQALHHVPELDVQHLDVEMQDGAVVLHGIAPSKQ